MGETSSNLFPPSAGWGMNVFSENFQPGSQPMRKVRGQKFFRLRQARLWTEKLLLQKPRDVRKIKEGVSVHVYNLVYTRAGKCWAFFGARNQGSINGSLNKKFGAPKKKDNTTGQRSEKHAAYLEVSH